MRIFIVQLQRPRKPRKPGIFPDPCETPRALGGAARILYFFNDFRRLDGGRPAFIFAKNWAIGYSSAYRYQTLILKGGCTMRGSFRFFRGGAALTGLRRLITLLLALMLAAAPLTVATDAALAQKTTTPAEKLQDDKAGAGAAATEAPVT